MAKKNNRKCICCSQEYRFCNSCMEDVNKPAWMAIYHNDNCRSLFNITTDYLAGVITKEDAKNRFSACDLSYKDKLHANIAKAIGETIDVKETVKTVSTEEVVVEDEDEKPQFKKKYNK